MAEIDQSNSTDVLLLADGEFVGEFVEVAPFATVSVLAHSDVGTANDGLQIEWSTDKVNVDDRQSFDYQGTASGLGLMVMATVRARYARVRYVNSNIDQEFFRLQTMLHDKTPSASIGYLGQSVTANDDALVVKAVLAARDITTGTNIVQPFASADPFLIVTNPPNRNTLTEQTINQSISSQQFDFFGLFGGTRREMSVFNDSAANLFLRRNNAASLTAWNVKLEPGCFWELPFAWPMWSGTLHGIWDAAGSGTAHVLEVF